MLLRNVASLPFLSRPSPFGDGLGPMGRSVGRRLLPSSLDTLRLRSLLTVVFWRCYRFVVSEAFP